MPTTSDLEIVSTRTIAAAPATVAAAWTDPARLARWWGPAGFRNTFHVCEPKPGGAWRFTMHGPDGKDYANENVFTVFDPPRVIAIDHVSNPKFRLTATFTDLGGKTKLEWVMRFEDAAVCAAVKPIVVPANEQNFDRLEAELGLKR